MINILRQVSILGILTAGMTFVIISGGMDLSVGSQLGLTGVLCAMLISEFGVNDIVSVILAVLVATAFGVITGLLIVSLNVSAIVITLGMQTVIRASHTFSQAAYRSMIYRRSWYLSARDILVRYGASYHHACYRSYHGIRSS